MCICILGRSAAASVTGRLLSTTLRLVTLVVASAYTANMAAMLIAKQFSPTTDNGTGHLTTLWRHVVSPADVIQYGTVVRSDVSELLQQSTRPWHRQAWLAMTSSNTMATDVDDGFEKVSNRTSYALLWHRAGLQYKTSSLEVYRDSGHCPCVKLTLDSEDTIILSYGFAVQRSAAIGGRLVVDAINQALVQLHQINYFKTLDNKLVHSL